MSISKHPIIPHLVRRVPEQFSWTDHRLVSDRHIDGLTSDAAALYLFLVTVGDGRGPSYYGDNSIVSRLGLADSGLIAARDTLIRRGMIDYEQYCRIRHLRAEGLKAAQIGERLELDPRTVRKWMNRDGFQP